MLGKLLKYEMKASARTLLPLYIGTLLVAAVCSFTLTSWIHANTGVLESVATNEAHAEIFRGFVFLLFFCLCVAIVVLTAMIVIQRFNKSLIGDEGYLMFTLPVTHVQLLSSKLLAGILWILLGTVVMGLSAMIIGAPSVLLNINWLTVEWQDVWQAIQYMWVEWQPLEYIMSTGLSGLSNMVAFVLLVYLSIMIAQMEQFNKHRVAIAVVLFFLLNWVFGLIETMLFQLIGIDFMHTITSYDVLHLYNVMMWSDVAFTVVQCIVCFAATVWLMRKKLNL